MYMRYAQHRAAPLLFSIHSTIHTHPRRTRTPLAESSLEMSCMRLHVFSRETYMASTVRRHQAASLLKSSFIAGAGHSAAPCSKCAAASLNSAAERGSASQALAQHRMLSTIARISGGLAHCPAPPSPPSPIAP